MVVDGHQHEPRLVVELASCCLLSPPPWGLLDERPVLRRHCFCYAVDLGDAKCGGSLQGPIAAYPYPFALPIYELLLLLLKTRTRKPATSARIYHFQVLGVVVEHAVPFNTLSDLKRMLKKDDPDQPQWLRRALRRAKRASEIVVESSKAPIPEECQPEFSGSNSNPVEKSEQRLRSFSSSSTPRGGGAAAAKYLHDLAKDADSNRGKASEAEGTHSAVNFVTLPDDTLLLVARFVLAVDLRAALRLCATSSDMHARLAEVVEASQRRMLRWLPSWTERHRIDADGRTLTAEGATAEDGQTLYVEDGVTRSWACGCLLPNTGVTRWSIRINTCTTGRIALGVCDQAGVCGWGIEPYSGALSRYTRDEHGDVHLLHPAPPPPNCPDGPVGLRLMAANLRDKAEGSVVEFSLDADRGRLGVTVDELGSAYAYPKTHSAHPRERALDGFPCGVALRPWAMLFLHRKDSVTLRGFAASEGADGEGGH